MSCSFLNCWASGVLQTFGPAFLCPKEALSLVKILGFVSLGALVACAASLATVESVTSDEDEDEDEDEDLRLPTKGPTVALDIP